MASGQGIVGAVKLPSPLTEQREAMLRAQIAARAWKVLALIYRKVVDVHEERPRQEEEIEAYLARSRVRIYRLRAEAQDVKEALKAMGEMDIPGCEGPRSSTYHPAYLALGPESW